MERDEYNQKLEELKMEEMYKQIPLAKENYENGEPFIRLFRLFASTDVDAVVIGELTVRQEGEPYEALSYYCGGGDPGGRVEIQVRLKSKAFSVSITKNLHDALRHLRFSDPKNPTDRVLWIDALSIHQGNTEEKASQIARMDRIFGSASNVCIWLGPQDEDTEKAFPLINKILDFGIFEEHLKEKDSITDSWDSLYKLMKRPWFGRRWAVQEIGWARSASIHCGSLEGKWTDLADAVTLFVTRSDDINRLFKARSKYGYREDYLGNMEALHAYRLVRLVTKLFHKGDKGEVQEKLMSLESLVTELSGFKTGHPYDVIYAILSLAEDARTVTRKTNRKFPELPSTNQSDRKGDGRTHTPTLFQQVALATTSSPKLMAGPREHGPPTSDADADADADAGIMQGRMLNPRSRIPFAMQEVPTPIPSSQSESVESKAVDARYSSRDAVQDIDLIDQTAHVQPTEDKCTSGGFQRALPFFRKLAELTNGKEFEVSYGSDSTFYMVCRDFVEFCIQRSRSINILLRPWAPSQKDLPRSFRGDYGSHVIPERLPSWICPASKSAFGAAPDGTFGRVSADILVGLPDEKPFYNASSGTVVFNIFGRAEYEFTKNKEDLGILSVPGFVLDTIFDFKDSATTASIPHDWLKFGGWTNLSNPPPDSFARTLVADRDQEGRNPPSFFNRACQYVFRSKPDGGALNVGKLAETEQAKHVRVYLNRLKAVVWERCLFKTSSNLTSVATSKLKNATESGGSRSEVEALDPEKYNDYPKEKIAQHKGTLGLGPLGMRRGDMVCILQGCNVPVVLRSEGKPEPPDPSWLTMNEEDKTPLQSSGQGKKERWRCSIVGECYVHGMMTGEAFKIKDTRQANKREYIFELV